MLKFVPTPIGNLEDITFRSLKALGEAEIFLCEDTRVTKKLLKLLKERFNTNEFCDEFLSLHSHNESSYLTQEFAQTLKSKNVVYVSDAGMPCISDPGAKLVDFCIKNEIQFDILPGANAVLTAFAMSGFEAKEFVFFGFLDHKGQNRAQMLNKAMQNKFVSIIYESPHRIEKLINEICAIDENRVVFVVKELTKMHQKFYKLSALELVQKFKSINLNGEWVVVIEPNPKTKSITIEEILALEITLKEKAKMVAQIQNISPKEAYNNLLKMDTK